ncbi:MAG: hypothetical protein ACP5N3_02945 [Candidatus Nanoarchaeia archaeon]
MSNFLTETKSYINDKLSNFMSDAGLYSRRNVGKILLFSLPIFSAGCGSQTQMPVTQAPAPVVLGNPNYAYDGEFSYPATAVIMPSGRKIEVREKSNFYQSDDLQINYLEFSIDTTLPGGEHIMGSRLYVDDERVSNKVNGTEIKLDEVVTSGVYATDSSNTGSNFFLIYKLKDAFPNTALRLHKEFEADLAYQKSLVQNYIDRKTPSPNASARPAPPMRTVIIRKP